MNPLAGLHHFLAISGDFPELKEPKLFMEKSNTQGIHTSCNYIEIGRPVKFN